MYNIFQIISGLTFFKRPTKAYTGKGKHNDTLIKPLQIRTHTHTYIHTHTHTFTHAHTHTHKQTHTHIV